MQECETRFMGEPEQGIALPAWQAHREYHECAWIDRAHSATRISRSDGVRDQGRLSVLGSHAVHDGDPPWGGRSEIQMPVDDHPSIIASNISAKGEEARATDIAYVRLRGWSAAAQGVTLCTDPTHDFR